MMARGMTASPSLALIGGSATTGGVEVFNARLAGLLAEEGVLVRPFNLMSHLSGPNRVWWALRYLAALARAVCAVIHYRPERVVVSCANILDVAAALTLAQLTRRRDIIAVAHFNTSWGFWRMPRLVRLLKHTSCRIRLFCIAPNQKASFERKGIQVESAIFPNFFHYAAREKPAQQPRAPGNPITALFVGRIVPEKRVDALARFLAEVADPTLPIQLRLVGDCASELRSDIAAASTPWLEIIFLGRKDEESVSDELHAADLFLSFSVSDTLPLNLLEAAAHQVPIVTRRNPVTEDVAELVGGVLFVEDEGDRATLRARMGLMLATPVGTQAARLIERNKSAVLDLLGIEKIEAAL